MVLPSGLDRDRRVGVLAYLRALRERFPHGDLLFAGGYRAQVRDGGRRAQAPAPSAAAHARRGGWRRGARVHLRFREPRGCRLRLGHSHGDRHRLRARRALASGRSRAAGDQGVLLDARDRRRPAGDRGHRHLLRARAEPALARGRRRRDGMPRGPEPPALLPARPVYGARARAVVLPVPVRRARDARGRHPGVHDPGAFGYRRREPCGLASPMPSRAWSASCTA